MKTNLLSVVQLEDKGMKFTIKDGVMTAIDKKTNQVGMPWWLDG